jgi:hypothetical protein
MATIVEHIATGKKYLLLGTGFGAYKATRPSLFFGNLAPSEEEGISPMTAVCDDSGAIFWVRSHEMRVVEVDGVKPGEALTKYQE